MGRITKIGLVDDHEWFRKALLDLITKNTIKFQVTIQAANGEDFISKISALQAEDLPDIVIMDINMPLMDGFATTKWLRENHPKIKVIALTLNAEDGPIIRMITLGVVGYLNKNIDAQQFISALETVDAQGFYYTESQKNIQQRELINTGTDNRIWAELSEKEKEFVRLCCTEATYKEMAPALKMGIGSVELMREKVFLKFKVKSRISLVIHAIKNNLV